MTNEEWRIFKKKFCEESNTQKYLGINSSNVKRAFTSASASTMFTKKSSPLDDFYSKLFDIFNSNYNDQWVIMKNTFINYSQGKSGGGMFTSALRSAASTINKTASSVATKVQKPGIYQLRDNGQKNFEGLIELIYKKGGKEDLNRYFNRFLNPCIMAPTRDGCNNVKYRYKGSCYECRDPLVGSFCTTGVVKRKSDSLCPLVEAKEVSAPTQEAVAYPVNGGKKSSKRKNFRLKKTKNRNKLKKNTIRNKKGGVETKAKIISFSGLKDIANRRGDGSQVITLSSGRNFIASPAE